MPACKFMESCGDATGGLQLWTGSSGATAVSTEQAHTGSYSIKLDLGSPAVACAVRRAGIMSDAGRRITFWARFPATPPIGNAVASVLNAAASLDMVRIVLLPSGKLRLAVVETDTTTTITDSTATLSVDTWHRIGLSYVITDTNTNEYRLYINGNLEASLSNVALANTGTDQFRFTFGTGLGDNFVGYFDDLFIDDGSDLSDIGDVQIATRAPAATNTNNFDTTIGTGANRWDYVNEVPISETNGLQHAGATDVQENFGLAAEGALAGSTYLAYCAWVRSKRGAPSSTPTHRNSAGSGSTNPTTTFTITIGSGVLAGDAGFVCVTSRDHTAGTAYPTVTDDDTGGNTWTRIAESSDRVATLWYKRATSGTASKTITVAGCVGSSHGGASWYGAVGPTSYTNISVESNASANETHAGFTPTNANSFICLAVFNYNNDNAVADQTCTTPGLLTERFDMLSQGGSDCGCMLASALSSGGPTATGDFTWTQVNGVTHSIVWAIPPDTVGDPKIMSNGSETSVVLTTSSASYLVITDSSSYPSNAAGIGMRSSGTTADTFLYDCGMMIAYIPPKLTIINRNRFKQNTLLRM